MRGHDDDSTAGCKQAMELFHRPHYVSDMLDQMYGANLSEGVVVEGEREVIEVGDDVGARVEVAINSDRAGVLVYSATYIEDQASRIRRQSSSVSTAKSACSLVMMSGGQRRMLFGPQPRIRSPRSKARYSRRSRRSGARSLVC